MLVSSQKSTEMKNTKFSQEISSAFLSTSQMPKLSLVLYVEPYKIKLQKIYSPNGWKYQTDNKEKHYTYFETN